MTSSEFWRSIDEQRGPGLLVLALLTSWKRVADEVGIPAVDRVSGMFDAIGRVAFADAALGARLSMTVFGGYWPGVGDASFARAWFDACCPTTIRDGDVNLPLRIQPLSVDRRVEESGRELFERAREELDALVADLPERDRYPALPDSWERATTR
jgi:hypothetical protein